MDPDKEGYILKLFHVSRKKELNHKVFITHKKRDTMLTIHTDPGVYGPEDDTFLLLEALRNEEFSGEGLEIGVGTGFIALHVCHHFKKVTGVDINPKAVELAVTNAHVNHIGNVHFFESDLFSRVEGAFDVIICNPPYVPADENVVSVEDVAYHGGEDGRQVIDKFLVQFPLYLTPEGKVYLLQSSLSGIEKTVSTLKKMGFSSVIIARQKLFFEELVVFKIKKGGIE